MRKETEPAVRRYWIVRFALDTIDDNQPNFLLVNAQLGCYLADRHWAFQTQVLTPSHAWWCLPNSSISTVTRNLQSLEDGIQRGVRDVEGDVMRRPWFLAHVFGNPIICLGYAGTERPLRSGSRHIPVRVTGPIPSGFHLRHRQRTIYCPI
jgi:hypothetical protein